jgi:hypothetical protein
MIERGEDKRGVHPENGREKPLYFRGLVIKRKYGEK